MLQRVPALVLSAAGGRHDALLAGPGGGCMSSPPARPFCVPLGSTENGEAIQILKYVDGQKYEPHTDYFHDK